MFEDFTQKTAFVNGVKLSFSIGGRGPPILLLHGHPQTRAIWHKVAPKLAQSHTVIASDLRGYGDSEKPVPASDADNYSKRVMAADQIELMRLLGHDRFALLAHDRGARVAFRLALDHPEVLTRLVMLDILPTLTMYENADEEFARTYWHWFFLIQPGPFPEAAIRNDPAGYLEAVMGERSDGLAHFTREAQAEYLRCLSLPGSAAAICADYRASAGVDLEHDRADREAGRRITAPLLALWGQNGAIEECFDPQTEWAKWADNVTCKALPSGHYIPEEVPELLLREVEAFLAR